MSDAEEQVKTTPEGDKLTAVARVTSLHTFPIKSCRRMDVDRVACTDIGVYLPEHNLYDR